MSSDNDDAEKRRLKEELSKLPFANRARIRGSRFQSSEGNSDASSEIVEKYLAEREARITENNKNKELGRQLIHAVREFDRARLAELLEQNAPVNYQDEHSGATAFHYAAGYGNRTALLMLLKTGNCDLLLSDNKGRHAADLADVGGDDPAMARMLMRLERKQRQRTSEDPQP